MSDRRRHARRVPQPICKRGVGSGEKVVLVNDGRRFTGNEKANRRGICCDGSARQAMASNYRRLLTTMTTEPHAIDFDDNGSLRDTGNRDLPRLASSLPTGAPASSLCCPPNFDYDFAFVKLLYDGV